MTNKLFYNLDNNVAPHLLTGKRIPLMDNNLLNCDSTETFETVRKEQLKENPKKKFKIGIINVSIEGRGDVSFAIKFIISIFKTFPSELIDEIIVFTKEEHRPMFLVNINNNNKIDQIFLQKISYHSISKKDNLFDSYISNERNLIDADILFIAPGTNANHFYLHLGDTKTENRIIQNTYILTEYNLSNKRNQNASVRVQDISVPLGLYDFNDCVNKIGGDNELVCNTGVFLPHLDLYDVRAYPNYPAIANNKYSIMYAYTGKEINSIFTNRQEAIPMINIVYELIRNVNYHDILNCNQTFVNEKWKKAMLLQLGYIHSYLTDVRNKHYKPSENKIVIYSPKDFITKIRAYVYRTIPYYEHVTESNDDFLYQWKLKINELYNYLDNYPSSPFIFEDLPSMSFYEMYRLFYHSLPIAFLSGDNTPLEFISFSRYEDLTLYYMAFYWKRDLAVKLGIPDIQEKGFGRTDIKRSTVIENIKNNFEIVGMYNIETLLIKAIKRNTDICSNTERTNISTRIEQNRFLYIPTLKINENSIIFHGNEFNAGFVRGKNKKTESGGFSGSYTFSMGLTRYSNDDIFVKFISINYPILNNKFYIEEQRSNMYYLFLTFREDLSSVRLIELHTALNAMLISYVINYIISLFPWSAYYLVKTYSVIPKLPYTGEIPSYTKTENIYKPRDEKHGFLFIQQYRKKNDDFYTRLKRKMIDEIEFNSIMLQVTLVLYLLQQRASFMHNDLWPANVILIYHDNYTTHNMKYGDRDISWRCKWQVNIIDLDTAFCNYHGKDFVDEKASKSKSTIFSPSFDIAYCLSDALSIYTMNKFQDVSTQPNDINILIQTHLRVLFYKQNINEAFDQPNHYLYQQEDNRISVVINRNTLGIEHYINWLIGEVGAT